ALGTYEGHAAIRAFLEEWIGAYDDFQFEFEEVHDLGNGVAYAVVVSTARPAGSTGSVQGRWGSVSIWVDGLCERVTNYFDIDEARAAAERLAEEQGWAVSKENVELVLGLPLLQPGVDAAQVARDADLSAQMIQAGAHLFHEDFEGAFTNLLGGGE